MTNVLKSKIAKAGLGLLVAAGLFAASSAGAMTMAEAQALVAALGLTGSQAQMVLALATPATTTGNCYQFTTLLKVGSTGEGVRQLQMVLNANSATALAVAAGNAGSPGHESMTFGPATANAVVRFQAWKGISPTAPQAGPATRAALNAMCVVNPNPNPTPTPTGPVTAMLATNNPGSGTLVAGQATADLAHFTFSGSGTVTALTLMKTGVSSNDTLSNVYLYNGGARLTDAASVTSGGVISFANSNGLFMVNGTTTISVRADIKTATSGQTVGVNLTGYTVAGQTTASTLMGNLMTIAATTDLATAFFATTNTVTGSPTVDAGTSNYTIWGNSLTVGQRAVWLKGANFRVIGSAETGALQNGRLVVDGAQVGSAVASVAANGTLSFDLSTAPLSLITGVHTVEVRADVIGGANRNFYVSLQNAGDLMLEDSQYHVNLMLMTGGTNPVTNVYNMATGGNGATVTVNQGTLSLTKDTTFNSTTTVTSGASNVTLARFNVKSYGEAVKVMQAVVGINVGATSGDYIQNVTLYANGAPLATSQTVDADPDTLTFNLGSSLVVPAGTTVALEVRADLMNTSGTNFAGTIATTVTIPQYQAQGMSSYALYPTASAGLTTTSTTVTAGSVVATFAKSSLTGQSYSTNTSGQKIGSYVLQAGTTEGVRVTNVLVALSGTITTTFVDSGSSTLTSTGSKTVNVASTAGMTVGDAVVVETGSTDFAGTIAAIVDADTLTVTGTTGGTTDPTTDGAVVTVTPISTSTAIPSNLSNLYLKVNGTALASAPLNPGLNNNFTTDFTVPAGATWPVDVFADLGSRTGTVITTTTLTARGASSNTTITDFDPNTGGTQTAITGQTTTLGTGTLGTTPSILTMSTSGAHYVVGNSSTEAIIRYNFTSTSGSSTITDLWFTTSGTAGAIASISATGANGGTCSAPVVGTSAHLVNCAIVVPVGFGGSDITVTPTYATVGYSGLTAGATAAVDLTHVDSTSGGTATGQTAVTAAVSSTMTLVATLPALTLTGTNNTLVPGQMKIGTVMITAGAGGNVKLNALPIRLTDAGGTIEMTGGTADVFLKEGSTTITTTEATSADITTGTSADVTLTFSNTEVVTAGTSRTFDVYMLNYTISGAGGDSVTTQLAPSSGFNWDDVNGGGTGLTGTLIRNFPTGTVTVFN